MIHSTRPPTASLQRHRGSSASPNNRTEFSVHKNQIRQLPSSKSKVTLLSKMYTNEIYTNGESQGMQQIVAGLLSDMLNPKGRKGLKICLGS